MDGTDPTGALRRIEEVVAAARAGVGDRNEVLAALSGLRLLREQLASWEPELITAARAAGASWVALAPALGVASRQAAERRYLRLQPSHTGEKTGEARVDAERDRRAGDRAVADWARRNSAILRQLAGRVSALDGLGPAAQESADRLGAALGDDDPATLLPPLAAAQPHLRAAHAGLAEQLGEISAQTDRLRRDAAGNRRSRE
ncbi:MULTISPECIES: HSP18 transcriptional regulator [unclassified Amycolatopsis]|uniref:HSP18 transcriptional regulator n=1 Tax=unclassified Amycolatopsis TaxID=2618356 RepID=UPI002876A421|nr:MULTISPECIES: HSP18 transcriptional regulator [unclassified Amycolatopsis]MDS0135741.1 HSP18 transcriptional regulator [Amycolatopsis sp. 505]MDS0145658.1 HSP18 transcriptional regulator [Amycolatopsis sp. CM201R]